MALIQDNNLLFPSEGNISSILIRKEIDELVKVGKLININTFNENSLESSSYDIRVGQELFHLKNLIFL